MQQTQGWFGRMLILGLVAIVPILNFAIIGYLVELVRNVANGRDTPLPELKIGEQIGPGFMFFIVMLLLGLLGGVASAMLFVLGILLNIAMNVYFKPALALAAIEGNPWVMFQFQRVFKAIGKNFLPVILLVLMDIVLGIVAASGLIACFVGVLFTIPFAMHVSGHYLGQLGRIIREQETS